MSHSRMHRVYRFSADGITRSALICLSMLSGTSLTMAAPMLTVSDGGTSNGNQLWLVEIAPDVSLFSPNDSGITGGSLAVELSFEVTAGQLVDVTSNTTHWPDTLVGNNPFTSGVSLGLQIDTTNDTAFAALGSQYLTANELTDDGRVAVLTIETAGTSPTTLAWGGHTIFPGMPNEYTGSRIAQGGHAFTDYVGSLTLGADADQDGDGDVDGQDFLQLQSQSSERIPDWEEEYGKGSAGPLVSAVTTVPEPTSLTLLLLVLTHTNLLHRAKTRHCEARIAGN